MGFRVYSLDRVPFWVSFKDSYRLPLMVLLTGSWKGSSKGSLKSSCQGVPVKRFLQGSFKALKSFYEVSTRDRLGFREGLL